MPKGIYIRTKLQNMHGSLGKHWKVKDSSKMGAKVGHVGWNTGLTKETDERLKIMGEHCSHPKTTTINMKGHCGKNTHNFKEKNFMYKKGYLVAGDKNPMFGKNMTGKNNPMFGKIQTENSRQKMRISAINYIKKNNNGNCRPRNGKYEKEILDKLQIQLGFSIKRQFFICGYFLDGYCQELNLAIEVDEEYHYKNNILRQKDIEKQINIAKFLNCSFLRLRISEIILDGIPNTNRKSNRGEK